MKIAICGKMGSGKSYLAHKLNTEFGFYKSSFAKKVKELASELFDMKEKDRGLLIDFATKMRSIDSYVWIRYMLKECASHENVVVDDLRLHNEYDTLKKEGWFFVKSPV